MFVAAAYPLLIDSKLFFWWKKITSNIFVEELKHRIQYLKKLIDRRHLAEATLSFLKYNLIVKIVMLSSCECNFGPNLFNQDTGQK